jgi:hypothetical protein
MTEETAQRIAIALERIADAFARDAEPATPECAHPHEVRTSHAVMGAPDRFLCDIRKGGCGYQNF